MKFQFREKKVKLPGNVHAYAEKKVMKLERFFDEDAEALIVFSVEKNRNQVELTVHGAGTWFRASESTSDMFASIDAAVATIEGIQPRPDGTIDIELSMAPFNTQWAGFTCVNALIIVPEGYTGLF